MIEDKGLAVEAADKIGKYVQLRGGKELVEVLGSDASLTAIPDAKSAIEDMQILFHYCEIMGAMDKVITADRGYINCVATQLYQALILCYITFLVRSHLTLVWHEGWTTTPVSSLKLC